MNTKSSIDCKVAEVVFILKAGLNFYLDASTHQQHATTQAVFSQLIEAHKSTINELQSLILQPKSHTQQYGMTASLSKQYQRLINGLTDDSIEAVITQILALEAYTLSMIDHAIAAPQPAVFKQYLHRVRIIIQDCIDGIKLLTT